MSSRELLFRMLLSRPSIAHRLPTALSLALAVNPLNNDKENIFPTTTSSPFDYLAHIRHLGIDVKDPLALPDWADSELCDVLPPQLMEYFRSDEFVQIYLSIPFRLEMVPTYFRSKLKVAILYRYYLFKVEQEVFWCLSCPILEQLQSLTILHMSTIKDYIKVVGRFRSLQHIRFVMPKWLESCLSNDNDKDYGIDNDGDTKGTHNNEVIRDMFRFVQEHTRLLPGHLKTSICL